MSKSVVTCSSGQLPTLLSNDTERDSRSARTADIKTVTVSKDSKDGRFPFVYTS